MAFKCNSETMCYALLIVSVVNVLAIMAIGCANAVAPEYAKLRTFRAGECTVIKVVKEYQTRSFGQNVLPGVIYTTHYKLTKPALNEYLNFTATVASFRGRKGKKIGCLYSTEEKYITRSASVDAWTSVIAVAGFLAGILAVIIVIVCSIGFIAAIVSPQ